MGVPAFFRWLSRKYPSIIVSCHEDNNVKSPEDLLEENPNGIEFDNVYLDMNGIIHPCCHPENKAAPENEDEMMLAIFEYIDRLFNILRPRKLLYMAIDGVAPRAKMNQQRSRRFRAAQESSEKAGSIAKVKRDLLERGIEVPDNDKPHFDSNCITPGTPFMFRLSKCLQFYIQDRMTNHPAWKKLKVILSDANVPGEGEHKIMDYIRKQRANPDHDPNTRHCLCGADADLIMLGLATHEPHFTIIREEFKPNQTRPCDLCGESDHELKDCQGGSSPASSGLEEDEFQAGERALEQARNETKFLFIRLDVLREYLEKDLSFTTLNVAWDFERLIDDWVFMCFFVGNDFLPHLPSLEIREGAIDRLIEIYKKTIPKLENYLTENGRVNLKLVQHILRELGELEDGVFKQRQETELRFKRRDQERKRKQANVDAINDTYYPLGGANGPVRPNLINFLAAGSSGGTPDGLGRNRGGQAQPLRQGGGGGGNRFNALSNSHNNNNNNNESADSDEDSSKEDDVRLWETGFKDRYYATKFKTEPNDIKFRDDVAKAYARGLCWVLLYYYQGCPAWNWFFPYHYAPFASDFRDISNLPNDFEVGTEPFKPLEQLMAVFPAASSKHVPPTWANLMKNPKSPIIDFYPESFCVDLNGKRFAWQGVALLPFVDEERLITTLQQTVYADLTEAELYRNCRSFDRLYIAQGYPAYEILCAVAQSGPQQDSFIALNASLTEGMAGSIKADPEAIVPGARFNSPLEKMNPIPDLQCVGVFYKDPQYPFDFIYPAKLLPNLKMPDKVLRPTDWDDSTQGRFRPSLGFRPSNSTDPTPRVDASGQRILNRTLEATMNYNNRNMGNNRPDYYNNAPPGGRWDNNGPGAYPAYNNAYPVDGHNANRSHYPNYYNNPHPSDGGRYQNIPMDYNDGRFRNRGQNFARPRMMQQNQPNILPYIMPRPQDFARPAIPPFVSANLAMNRYPAAVNRPYSTRGLAAPGQQGNPYTGQNFEDANFTWQQQMLQAGQHRPQPPSYRTNTNQGVDRRNVDEAPYRRQQGRSSDSGSNNHSSNNRNNYRR